jgi:hypothetical protein
MLSLASGNALSPVHGISSRTSIEPDFSIAQEFFDLPRAKERIFGVLKERFDAAGYAVFDQAITVILDARFTMN